jgi:hypothetical protein
MNPTTISRLIGAALLTLSLHAGADQGPSTSTAPYLQPIASGLQFTSILTTGDAVKGYRMAGIPDGLGAYDNGDGTFTVLMNHEHGNTVGVPRAHGAKGAFVSEWVIDKKTLTVISGGDLMKSVWQKDTLGAWVKTPAVGAIGQTTTFSRFCSADLPARQAFWNSASHKGTKNRIFMNGEESGPTFQRGLAHVATGPDKGNTYVLPEFANANSAWENILAYPHGGDRTVVIGTADGGTNGVYVYIGHKSRSGNDVERAGLVGGTMYRIAVAAGKPETRDADAGLGLTANVRTGVLEAAFSLTADQITSVGVTATTFLRPEDGAWDKKDRNRFYFVTTDRPDAAKDGNLNTDIPAGQVGRSRLWALDFKNASRPELGGTIRLLLNGTPEQSDHQMFDNITVNDDGSLILLEDIGNNQHNGKVWKYQPRTGTLTKLAHFDVDLFGDIGLAGSQTKDEETSGVIDITDLLDRDDGKVYNLLVAQNHKASADAELVEGGQLMLMVQDRHHDTDEHDNDDNDDGHDGE